MSERWTDAAGFHPSSLTCPHPGVHSGAFDESFIGYDRNDGRQLWVYEELGWARIDGLTPRARCAEREPSGGQVLLLTGGLDRGRGLKPRILEQLLLVAE